MLISKHRPLKMSPQIKSKLMVDNVMLSHGLTKDELSKLKSCCWHKKNHKWGHFDNTGDYILTNNKVKINKIYIPHQFNYIQRDKLMFSDHKPVIANITL